MAMGFGGCTSVSGSAAATNKINDLADNLGYLFRFMGHFQKNVHNKLQKITSLELISLLVSKLFSKKFQGKVPLASLYFHHDVPKLGEPMDHSEHTNHDNCKTDKKVDAHAGRGKSSLGAAAHATLHCLTGCIIGEVAGLMIGVTFGLHQYSSMGLATLLAYISGFSLTIFPLMKSANLTFRSAFKAIWLGEAISIGVMELVMNSIDYHMGGIRSGSVFNPLFWEALAIAVPAGYIAAFPVNYWLIGKEMKRCH